MEMDQGCPRGQRPHPSRCIRDVGWNQTEVTTSNNVRSAGQSFRQAYEDDEKGNQRLAGLKQEARQPRLATEADVPTETKTRKRLEDAAAVKAKFGDRCPSKRVQAGLKSSTSLGMKAESPLSLAGMTSWSTKALRRQSRVSHPWRRAR